MNERIVTDQFIRIYNKERLYRVKVADYKSCIIICFKKKCGNELKLFMNHNQLYWPSNAHIQGS